MQQYKGIENRLFICEECGAVIDSQLLDNVKARNIKYKGQMITYQFFQCPECKHKFEIRYTSAEIRQLQDNYIKQVKSARATLDKIEKLTDEIREYFDSNA